MANQNDFLHIMKERGFVHQHSNEEGLAQRLNKEMVTCYIGFDCTAPSLHVGSMLPIMMLRWFQKCGHKPIVLMGGGTTRVGDPSGKDKTRQILTDELINQNKDGIKNVFSKFLTFGEKGNDALMVDNADWLLELNYVSFLRDIGRHFSLNRMLTFESVKQRLEREQPLSFLEFNYMILQAYDFLELNKRYGCSLQMGGSDQWGNIINGIDLTRRVNEAEVFALTAPLLTTSSGAKMGKTADGAVWLSDTMLKPYDYWQYWRNTEDGDVGRFLKLFTELPLDEIAKLEALDGAEINEAKKILANEATRLLHGEEAARTAEETAQKTFEQGTLGNDLPRVSVDLSSDMGILTALVEAGLASSNGEARRHVQGGAIKVNDEKIGDIKAVVTQSMANENGMIKLSMGKKKHVLLLPI